MGYFHRRLLSSPCQECTLFHIEAFSYIGDKKASLTNGSTRSSERRTNSTRHHNTRTDYKARGRRKGEYGPLSKPGEGERSRGRNRSRSPVRVRLSNYYEV